MSKQDILKPHTVIKNKIIHCLNTIINRTVKTACFTYIIFTLQFATGKIHGFNNAGASSRYSVVTIWSTCYGLHSLHFVRWKIVWKTK